MYPAPPATKICRFPVVGHSSTFWFLAFPHDLFPLLLLPVLLAALPFPPYVLAMMVAPAATHSSFTALENRHF